MKLYDQTIGHKNILGTQWPISVIVERIGPKHYQTYYLCNKIAEKVKRYSTRRSAIEDAESRLGQAHTAQALYEN